MKNKTLALTAVAALALPVAAHAAKPAESGKQGREKAAEKRQAAVQKREAAKNKPKGKAFVVKGTTSETALPVADGALTGPLTLDPKSANRHARRALELTRTLLRDTHTETFGVEGDAVRVRYSGLEATDALTSTDKIKVRGKVLRDGSLDIRRIVVVRDTEDDEQDAEQTQS